MTSSEEDRVCTLASHTERFIQERRYLRGVSAATEEWYRYSFHAFGPVLEEPYQSSTALKGAVQRQIASLLQTNKPVSINTYLRCLKAFLRWCHQEGILGEPVNLGWLKEEERILPTLRPEQVRAILQDRAKGRCAARLHTLVCLLLDTGLRIGEALSLRGEDVDLDNLVLRVRGKGNKHRLVPFSLEMRKILYRHLRGEGRYVFSTRSGGRLSQRDVLRDLKSLGERLGITGVRMSPHTLRHTFAVNYLRAGGNAFYLQRILGHSTLEMTNRYLSSLGVEDLRAVHDALTALARS